MFGTFQLKLNTSGHQVINYHGITTSGPIAHNAYGNVSQSGGDGSSMQEMLQAMDNIGSVAVTRSAVNPKSGGYTWTITFLRDGPSDSGARGQWGNDCEQRDSFYQLCNSPGNVPQLTYLDPSLGGNCLSTFYNGTLPSSKFYNCTKVTIMTGDSAATKQPPGSKAVQRIYFDNGDYNSTFGTQTPGFSGCRAKTPRKCRGFCGTGNSQRLGGQQGCPDNASQFPRTFCDSMFFVVSTGHGFVFGFQLVVAFGKVLAFPRPQCSHRATGGGAHSRPLAYFPQAFYEGSGCVSI